MDLVNVYKNNKINDNIVLEGWIRNHRPQKEYGFIDFFDGTCFESIQVVYDNTFHDRYFILDNKYVYHCGTSINRIGYKTFSINLISDEDIRDSLISHVKKVI